MINILTGAVTGCVRSVLGWLYVQHLEYSRDECTVLFVGWVHRRSDAFAR